MSHDIIIIDHQRFSDSKEFWEWYDTSVENQQGDYRFSTPTLQQWFLMMKDRVRPLNGDFSPSEDEIDTQELRDADYGFGKDFIYVALAYSDADKTTSLAFNLANEFHLAYLDISGDSVLHNTDGSSFVLTAENNDSIEFEKECQKELSRRRMIVTIAGILAFLLCGIACRYSPFFEQYICALSALVIIPIGIWVDRWFKRTNEDVRKKHKDHQD